jgi:signal transduction histidine kinase
MTSKQERLLVLGRLSSMLAHEIRNPLAGISAATQLLRGKLDGADPRRKYVGMILKEVDRVDEIVKNLLDYSREGRACMMRADLPSILDTAVSIFRDRLDATGVEVVSTHDEAVPFVVCDMDMLGRAFRNLIANGIDAMPSGGTLLLRTAYDAAGGWVSVHVEDTGIGVEVDDLTELFSPFYTTKTKGNGLGLPVAVKCIEEHGGTITAHRRAAGGLAMVVRWPVNPLEADGDPTQEVQDRSHPGTEMG